MKKKKIMLATAVLAGLANTASAAVDFSGLTTGLVDQVEDAAGYALPVIAVIVGVTLVFKLVKRWAK